MSAIDRLADLRNKAQAKPKASREFVSDVELVATHYQLKELGEYEEAKQAARDDMANAIPCYAALASEIRGNENMATGINERIRASLELQVAA